GSQPASPDGSYDLRRQIAQWTESLVNRTILPVRRVVSSDGTMVDLRTRVVVPGTLGAANVDRFLHQSRAAVQVDLSHVPEPATLEYPQ
ncbi:MAG: hypothetical protein AAGA03_09080, partial [Planctomycetota bacterium]